jgi:FeS assembly protein IscX
MLRWQDTYPIVFALEDQYPTIDILGIRFTDLRQWILDLENFDDHPDGCNEKILEAIQMAWLDERAS